MNNRVIVDTKDNLFVLLTETTELLQNRRLKISFKRLRYFVQDGFVCIPFEDDTQIKTLQELQLLLKKFGYITPLTEVTKKNVEEYHREETVFTEFSELAYLIRNNRFEENPHLIQKFVEFQQTVQKKLVRDLYRLQELSAFHMAFAQNACNFSVPGAGKTSIVYGAYAYLRNLPEDHHKHVDNLLIIGPISSFAPWENEYKACFGTKAKSFRMSGTLDVSRDDKKEHLHSSTPAELTLVFHGGVDSYQRDIVDFLKRNKTMVVVDEAHRIKNPEGVWGRSVTEISKNAISRIVLTGTPVPNGYQDIYNLYKFIYPFKYKDILQFHYQNLEDMTQNSEPNSARVQELKNNISPFFIRIKKDDLGLPPTTEKVVRINMNERQREIYDFVEASYMPSFQENSSATAKDILNRAKLIRLRQASTNPSLLLKPLEDALDEFDPNFRIAKEIDEVIGDSEFLEKVRNYADVEIPAKFTEISKLVKEIISKEEKVIIWTIFVKNAETLQEYLQKRDAKSKLLIGRIVPPQVKMEFLA
ncbi:DEAD/DEAH box helicase, partial [Candidatus Peregrinibacteria bacterium]|nr:DEAD/DEAH box helicase [Candidatus Peregrinibacteria bacterium]